MMRSMYSGVSGLRAHQTKMDVIGNNIANVNTLGYKSQRVTFNEIFSQTIQSASAASDETGRGGRNPMQVGLGVNVASIDVLMTQGAAQRTDNPFDLMIDGDGFIIVGDATGTYFTRAGALRQDDDGNLIIPNGMIVKGWPASEDGKAIQRGTVQNLKLNDPSNKSTPPEATTKIQLSGNLNITDGSAVTQIQMYDSLGNLYSTNLKLTYDTANQAWTVEPDQLYDAAGESGTTHVKFTDASGKVYYIANPFPTTGNSIKFDSDGNFDTTGTLAITMNGFDIPDMNATVGGGAGGSGVEISLSSLTQFAKKTNLDPKRLDGKAAGNMIGFKVAGDGKITASYDNGDERLLGQIVLASFDNPAGLEKIGDNIFAATANSGDFDGIGDEGVFQAGVLEMSNVDLSREFTDMITTQRGFQANSKIITVSDEMLQELANLKR
jgi:flagellar hook protein FlgE